MSLVEWPACPQKRGSPVGGGFYKAISTPTENISRTAVFAIGAGAAAGVALGAARQELNRATVARNDATAALAEATGMDVEFRLGPWREIRSALRAGLVEESTDSPDRRRVTFTIVNTGAAHYLPTGTPDRHLSVQLRLLDSHWEVVEQEEHLIKRTILWRPFIIDLWDTRLPRWQPHSYHLEVNRNSKAVAVEVVVRYHLLAESRRKRIGYENTQPIAYEVFRQRRALQPPSIQQETE